MPEREQERHTTTGQRQWEGRIIIELAVHCARTMQLIHDTLDIMKNTSVHISVARPLSLISSCNVFAARPTNTGRQCNGTVPKRNRRLKGNETRNEKTIFLKANYGEWGGRARSTWPTCSRSRALRRVQSTEVKIENRKLGQHGMRSSSLPSMSYTMEMLVFPSRIITAVLPESFV